MNRIRTCLFTSLLFFSIVCVHKVAQAVKPVPPDSVGPYMEEDMLGPEEPNLKEIWSPDWCEPKVAAPEAVFEGPPVKAAFGVIAPSAQQPRGALTGRVVFMNSGHGWTFDPTYWRLQRPDALLEMNEDYGNLDQLNFFAAYCFNAGAVVA